MKFRFRRKIAAVALLGIALSVLIGATPAHANDPGVDAALCLQDVSGSLALASPTMTAGNSTTMTWSTNWPAECYAASLSVNAADLLGAFPLLPHAGSMTVTAPVSGAWSLIVTDAAGATTLRTVNVTVNPPAPLPSGSIVNITSSGTAQRALFIQGMESPNTTVRVAGPLNVDLSDVDDIQVAPGVQLLGDRTANPLGPRLFTTTFPRNLLLIGNDPAGIPADNVRVSGVRLDGEESSNPGDSADGVSEADAIEIFSSQHVEVDHDDIYGWRGVAVGVFDRLGRINWDNAQTVSVHDNYIHDNQHPTADTDDPFASGHGAGYGVLLSQGAYAWINRNVFTRNRHSITGDGRPGTGYYVYDNLFLDPGVDDIKDDHISYNHQIDMHGRNDCKFLGLFGESYNCGPAGEYVDFADNTVTSTQADSIQLRGTPEAEFDVENNVFGNSKSHALTQTESGLIDGGGNVFSATAFNDRKSCDFDGDGVQDAFMATGVTWWYQSSVTGHWMFLRRSTKHVADVTLLDYSGDGRCDVNTGGVTYLTPATPGAELVLHASGDDSLWRVAPTGAGDQSANVLGMAPGSNPAIAALDDGGFETAFDAYGSNDLWYVDKFNIGHDTHLAMRPGSSPAITALPGGGAEIAYVDPTGRLWVVGPDGSAYWPGSGLGVAPGTSPAIVALADGGFEIAFQANGEATLWTVTADNVGQDSHIAMRPGSSPAMAALPRQGVEIAYVGTDNALYDFGPTENPHYAGNGLGVAPGTSPTIAIRPTGGFALAFQAYGEATLWTVTADNVGHDTAIAMTPGSSPAVAALSTDSYEIAFEQASDGLLHQLGSDGVDRMSANGLGLAPSSSPAVTALG